MSLSSDKDFNEVFNVYRSFGVDIDVKCRFGEGIIEVGDNRYKVDYSPKMNEARGRKHALYAVMSDYTGITLPWGSLTGIRPTKLAYELLVQGKTVDDLADYGVSKEKIEAVKAILENQEPFTTSYKKVNFYVHIPFCSSRCNYCSFVSMPVNKKTLPLMQRYTELLKGEIESGLKLLSENGYEIDSIYVGGGTPTALSAPQLEQLMSHIARTFDLKSLDEYTVEAGRPDCTDEEKLRIIKEYGATRISINPQTFSDEVLRNIGRRHTAQDILDCYRTARRVGHDNINMDLIAGLPGDTVEGFRHSLQTAIDLDPENITVHTLTLKRASNLVVEHRAADYADVAAMVESCELLEKAGYRPYYLYRQKGTLQNLENVGWCKPGYECLYNIYIMEEVHTILSAGAGGSTKLVAPGARHGKIERIFNYKYPTEYIDRFDTILARKEGVKQFYDQYPNCGESARPQAHGGV